MKAREKLKVYEIYKVQKDKKGKSQITKRQVSFKEALQKANKERKMIESVSQARSQDG